MNLQPVATLNRHTIADGDKLHQYVIDPLSGNDKLLADAIYDLSGKSYEHDTEKNAIFHYKDNDPTKEKVYAFSAQSLSADYIKNVNLTATNVHSTNVTSTNIYSTTTQSTNTSAINLTAVSDNVYVLSAANGVPKKLVDIIDALLKNWQATEDYITAQKNAWSSISAISAQGMSTPFTGNTFTMKAGQYMQLNVLGADTVEFNAAQQETIYVNNPPVTVGDDEIYSLIIR